jgi:hypothetical protein
MAGRILLAFESFENVIATVVAQFRSGSCGLM